MIKEEYVSFEVARLLKDKGFPQSTFRCHYIIDGNIHYKSFKNRCGFGDYDIIAPTIQMAMKWLEQVHGIHLNIIYDKICDKGYWGKGHWTWNNEEYNSHEEACEAAIKYCLENLI